MDLATVVGLVVALVGIVGGNMVEGGSPIRLINIPGAMIVFGGTIGATMMGFPLSTMVQVPKFIMKAFFGGGQHDSAANVDLFCTMADKARREGLLALEADVEKIDDEFTRKGVQLMIDGTDPELLREIMEIEAEAIKHRHEGNYAVFEAMGGIAPTIGVLGAVMGLMGVMAHLDNPAEIGPGVATAFVATFYGVSSANVLWIPIGNKLKANSKHEQHALAIVIEGLMSIQSGDNPRIVREKLEGFLGPAERNKGESKDGATQEREAA